MMPHGGRTLRSPRSGRDQKLRLSAACRATRWNPRSGKPASQQALTPPVVLAGEGRARLDCAGQGTPDVPNRGTLPTCPTTRSGHSRRRPSATSPPSSSETRACSPAAGAPGSTPRTGSRTAPPRTTGRLKKRRGRGGRPRGAGLRRRPRHRLGRVRNTRGAAQHPPPQGVPRHRRATSRLPGHVHPGRARPSRSRAWRQSPCAEPSN